MPESNEKLAEFQAAQQEYQAQVVQPAFFDRLAERGYAPQNEKQAQAFLHMGLDLAERADQHKAKQASARAPMANSAYVDYCRLVGIEPVVDFSDSGAEKAARAAIKNPDALGAASRLFAAIADLEDGE